MCEKKITSPLSIEEIKLIDATGLPMVDRHHLRLLAHCLASFKTMANDASSGPLPEEQDRLEWLMSQPAFTNEIDFVIVLLEQFSLAGNQLERLAATLNISPLELTLEKLIISCFLEK